MKLKNRSTVFTLWANRVVAAILFALLFLMPRFLRWYTATRSLPDAASTAILVAFYCCAAFVGLALATMEQLLHNILNSHVFIRKNVRLIRRIRWCCFAVALVCTVAAFSYLPLVFVAIITAFLWLVIQVVVDVMDAAVTLREESDLTI